MPGNSGTCGEFQPNFIVQSGFVKPVVSYTLPPDKLVLAVDYAFARHVLYFSSVAFSLIVILALIWFHVAPRLRGRRLPVVIAIIYAILTLFDLPSEMISHTLSRHYGISKLGWSGWFADWAKAQAISLVITVVVVWAFYALLRRKPRRWWLYAWAACVPLIVFSVWLEPVVIEPLFNSFDPLAKDHPELIQPIERVLQRAGVS